MHTQSNSTHFCITVCTQITSRRRLSKRGIKSEDATPLLRLLFRPSSCKRSLKNPHLNANEFTHKCKQVHKWKASCKFKFNSLYINVTTSKYILMKIANIFLIHIFMDLYYIYLKQGTYVCASEMCLWFFFSLLINIIFIHTDIHLCALKCICEKRVICI